jgi:hypothetical protein
MIVFVSSLLPNEASNTCNEKNQRRDGGTGRAPGLALEWPTNAGGYHVQYATNRLSPVVWQRFSGNPATYAGNFHQTIGPALFISLFGVRCWMFPCLSGPARPASASGSCAKNPPYWRNQVRCQVTTVESLL